MRASPTRWAGVLLGLLLVSFGGLGLAHVASNGHVAAHTRQNAPEHHGHRTTRPGAHHVRSSGPSPELQLARFLPPPAWSSLLATAVVLALLHARTDRDRSPPLPV